MLDRFTAKRVLILLFTALVFCVAVVVRHTQVDSIEGFQVLFHAIPALLVIPLVLYPFESPAGPTLKSSFLFMLIGATVIGEAAICILIASPLILGMAFLLKGAVDLIKRPKKLMAVPVILLVPFAAGFIGDPNNVVEAELTTDSTIEVVRESIETTSTISPVEDGLLGGLPGARFPQPEKLEGHGLDLGDSRVITFDDGGQIELEVVASTTDAVTFDVVDNTVSFANWLDWESTTFEWTSLSSGETKVVASVSYERKLAPGWYFDPLVSSGMNQAVEHLLVELVGDID